MSEEELEGGSRHLGEGHVEVEAPDAFGVGGGEGRGDGSAPVSALGVKRFVAKTIHLKLSFNLNLWEIALKKNYSNIHRIIEIVKNVYTRTLKILAQWPKWNPIFFGAEENP